MGYFGQQIYNEPMSMYVDPRLDILANSLGAVQKRHDDNYAQMSALDIMAHNTKVAEGDKSIKDAALGRLKTQRDAIAGSGDYAYAAPRIGLAVKDWSNDQTLIEAKNNQIAIEEHDKQRQAMRAAGHIDLDFNPADNWTTIDPNTKQTRRFTSKLEKKLDWDARAQDVSKLLENTENIGLTAANVRDFLQHGSITGITDKRVKDNLENAITRFMTSAEGDQMKRSLTKIDGLSDSEANTRISDYLMSVGRAQVHEKVNMDYQVNSPALQREGWAREDARAAAELELKKKIAENKLTKEGLPIPPPPSMHIMNSPSATIAPSVLKDIIPQDENGDFKIDASKNIIDFAKIPSDLSPQDRTFVNLYDQLRDKTGDKDASPDDVNRSVRDMGAKVKWLNQMLKTGKNINEKARLPTKRDPEGWMYQSALTPEDKAHYEKELKTANEKLGAVKVIQDEAKKQGVDLTDTERYKTLAQDPSVYLGKALNIGGQGKFRMYTDQPNKVNVDGVPHLVGEMVFTQKDLENRLTTTTQKGGGTYNKDRFHGIGSWKTLVDKGIIKPAGTDPKTNEQLYSIPTKYPIQNTREIRRKLDINSTSEGVYKENAASWEQTHADYDYTEGLPKRVQEKESSMKTEAGKKAFTALLSTAMQNQRGDMIEEILNASEAKIIDAVKSK